MKSQRVLKSQPCASLPETLSEGGTTQDRLNVESWCMDDICLLDASCVSRVYRCLEIYHDLPIYLLTIHLSPNEASNDAYFFSRRTLQLWQESASIWRSKAQNNNLIPWFWKWSTRRWLGGFKQCILHSPVCGLPKATSQTQALHPQQKRNCIYRKPKDKTC